MIKVNGYTINPDKVTMLDRKTRREHLDGGRERVETGVFVRFAAGGCQWINDPEAREVEAQFLRYDSTQETELPY